MAVIQKIRDKYAKLAGFVIALALVGFLLMDAGDNLKRIFSGGSYVAKVNGSKVEAKDYAERVNELESLYDLMGQKLDDNSRAQVHQQVLNEMVFEKLTEDEMEDLGLTVTADEEKEMFNGANPDPMVQQFPHFRNPETNQFDPQYLVMFEKNQLPNTPEAQKALEQWHLFKNYIKRAKLQQKYNSMFAGAIYTPKFLTDRASKDQAYQASISFVKVPYTTVSDAEIKVTDEDLKDYMKKREAQYRVNQPSRTIEYVSFDATPSAEDTSRTVNALQQLKSEFAATTEAEGFVNRNSEEPYNGSFVTKKSFMSPYADSILNLPVGAIYGPYFENNAYKLTKVMDKKSLPDSVKVRHILVKTEDRGGQILADSVAKKKIDSVEMMVKSGVDFKQVATKYSDDPGSKATGGEYDFSLSQRGQISKEFGDVAFEGKVGEKKIVKVDNEAYAGYHYIEVLSQKNIEPSVKLATIAKSLYAAEETENNAFAKAQEFAGKNGNGKAFDETVKTQGLNKLQGQAVKPNDFAIPGLGSSRDIIRWMYEAKVGDVSPVFPLEGRYVVAKLASIQKEGLPELDASNRPMLEALVKNEKKAAKILEKYKGANINAIAQGSGQPLQNADSFNAATSYFPAIGFEPKVIGYSFYDGFKPGATSPGIKGQDGVFFISLKNRQQNAVANADPMMNAQQQMMQTMQLKGSLPSMMQDSRVKAAEVKYDVNNLY